MWIDERAYPGPLQPDAGFAGDPAGWDHVDATFGAGGHTRGILERLNGGRLIAFDADPQAQERASLIDHPAFTFVPSNFRELCAALDRLDCGPVDGVLYDLGVSSMQFDDASRGFSFRESAPLDMRMNPRSGPSAFDILTTASESELADIFFHYGQERASRRIARVIVQRRTAGTLPSTTLEFGQMVSGLLHRSGERERIHPATRVFQALRIAVNDELDALRESLDAAAGRLRNAGRIVAISFHSLEDRIVKHKLRDDDRLEVLTRKPMTANEDEIARNPRARSAKLRAAQRKASEMVSQPRIQSPQRVRTAKNATQRRISHKGRARYRNIAQFTAGLAIALVLLMGYVTATAHLTSLNYSYAKAQQQRAALQAQTARLEEQLAALRSDDRLSAIATRLHMQDPQQFALVTLPAPVRGEDRSHLAFLSGLASFFGAK